MEMKLLLSVLCIAAAALLPAAENGGLIGKSPVVRQALKLSFADTGFAPTGESRGFRFEPSAGGTIVFSWKNDHPAWMEGCFRRAARLPDEDEMEFRLAVDVPDAGFAATFALRFRDALGESFQLPGVALERGRAGRRELVFRFDASGKLEHWGGDGRIDRPLELSGLSMAFAPDTAGGSVTFDSIVCPSAGGVLDGIDVRLAAGNDLFLLSEQSSGPVLTLVNRAVAETEFTVALTATDFRGKKLFEETRDLVLASGESAALPVADPTELLGVRILDCELSAPAAAVPIRRRFFYGRMIPAGPGRPGNPEFLFGIHDHTAVGDCELRAKAAALCGAKVIRGAGLSWGMIQQLPDRWNFKESDEIVRIYERYGLEMMMILAFTPPWCIASPRQPVYPGETQRDFLLPDLAAYENYARVMAERYRGKIRLFETWNEPDISFANFSVENYLKLQAAGRRGVKAANPDAIVMNGGIALMTPSPGKETIQRDIMASVGTGCDWYAVHGHGPFPEYVNTVAKVLELRREFDSRAVWHSNETAMSAAGGMEKEQAETLFKKLLYAWKNGAAGYNWYDLVNDGYDPFNHEHNFGLLTRDYMPKPAYFVYNMLARRYGLAVRAGELAEDGPFYSAIFRAPDALLLPLWRESGGSSPVILLSTDARSAEVIDLMDNAEPLELREGLLILPVGTEPLTLRLAGATRVELAGTLLTYSGFVLPGRHAELSLKLRNLFEESGEFKLNFGEAGRTLRLEPGESAEVKMRSPATENAAPELTWNFAGTPGRLSPVLPAAVPVPAGAESGPDIRLNHSRQRVELYPNDPNRLFMTWRGPEDLSAAASLSFSAGTLTVEVEVTDDIHSQPCMGTDLYNGDGIQLGVAAPGSENGNALLFGAALGDSGKVMTHIWKRPAGIVAAGSETIRAEVTRSGRTTRYRIGIPFSMTGMEEAAFRCGFLFNLLVNDNDGHGRKGWLELAPGIGMGLEARKFPLFVMTE